MFDMILFAFAIFGFICASKIFLSWLINFCIHFLRCNLNLQQIYGNKEKKSTWCGITGATGDLGFDYACEFAQRGFNILFIVRNEEKAQEKMSQLKKLHPDIEVALIQCDLGQLPTNAATIQNFQTQLDTILEDKDIGVFINNAALNLESWKFGDLPLEQNLKLINVNISSVIVLTQLIIPYMQQRNKKQKCRSLIINVGSFYSDIRMPKQTLYGASKVWMDYFSVNASVEYEKDGIDIIVTNPGLMESGMTKFQNLWCNGVLGVTTTKKYAKQSMKHFGRKFPFYKRRGIHYWYHDFINWLFGLLPMELGFWVKIKVLRPLFDSRRDLIDNMESIVVAKENN